MKASIKSLLIISLLFNGLFIVAQVETDSLFTETEGYSEREFTFSDTIEEKGTVMEEFMKEIVNVDPVVTTQEWDTSNIAAIREGYTLRQYDTVRLNEFRQLRDFDFSEAKNSESMFSQYFNRMMEKLFGSLNTGFKSKALKYILMLLATILLVWFLLKNELKTFVKKKDKNVIQPQAGDLDISVSRDLLLENLEKAEAEGKYREAVRYSYLMTLKKLNEENKIVWRDYKLGQDYVNELKDKKTKKDFQAFTDYFNYTWYGNYEVDQEFYNKTKALSSHLQEKTEA